jgi:hypothetical protein
MLLFLSLLCRFLASADETAQVVSFGRTQQISLAAEIELTEQSTSIKWSLESFRKNASLHVLRQVVTAKEAAAIIKAVPIDINVDEDSVDALPTYEWPVESAYDGREDSVLKALTQPIISERILPYVASTYNCSNCGLCTSMIRRYLPTERRKHPKHFDTQAFVTVVVSLNEYGMDFTGGLFVRSGTDESRQFLDLQTGDAAIHQYDLEHGVEVTSGTRYSWIMWFQDRECAPNGHLHWHDAAAAGGDPVAMFNVANVLSGAADTIGMEEGGGGEEAQALVAQSLGGAFEWYTHSANAGYYGAMYSLGIMYYRGTPSLERDEAKAVHWLQRAALHGEVQSINSILSTALYSLYTAWGGACSIQSGGDAAGRGGCRGGRAVVADGSSTGRWQVVLRSW